MKTEDNNQILPPKHMYGQKNKTGKQAVDKESQNVEGEIYTKLDQYDGKIIIHRGCWGHKI